MAEAEPLAQLRDIHLPEQIGWWPLASGWYVLMALVLILVIALVYYFYKKYLNSLPKKKALELLKTYTQQYEKDRNTQLASARISELLRRVALVYYPRTQVASIHGDGWIDFLNQTGKNVDFTPVKSMLLDSPFKTSETVNLKPLITRAEQWIKQRGVPCLN
ncbi:DUF4381 domain-containing protein [Legionella shakespearei]|uniref:DUF4381 domain-containing protein n=1 Tax=Legionella shakespearei DSM 23087 TaxID=1122169 RepID=A0A0W0YL14_9GAMM|nr:DUF4381 domain-containing protein [Legionella shakespearei]KTD57499.1 hypothetical protein Lsha_2340 [Legionella shakespearei DSM 23087]